MFSIGSYHLLIVVVGLCLLGLFLVYAYKQREQAIVSASVNEAAILADRLQTTLRRVEAASTFIRESIGLPAVDAAASGAESQPGRSIDNAGLALLARGFPEIAALTVFDAEGRLLLSSAPAAMPVLIDDRPYFVAMKAEPKAGLHFSETQVNRLDGAVSVMAHEAILDEQGRLAGLIVIPINLPYFQQLFAGLDVGVQGVVSVRRSDDSRLVARWPELPGRLNQEAPGIPPFELIRAGQSEGVVQYIGASDGIERIFAFRAVSDYPFFVLVGRSVEEQFVPWHKTALAASLLTLGAMLILTLLQRLLLVSQRKLDESRKRFDAIVNSRDDAFCRWLPDTTLIHCNNRYAELFGEDSTELIGRRWIDMMPLDERQALHTAIATMADHPDIRSYEHQIILKDGGIGWMRWLDLPMVDAKGRCVEFQSIGQDITEAKRTELRLQQLAMAVEQSPSPIIITDIDGTIDYVNDAFTRVTGYPREEAIGQNPRMLNGGDTPRETYRSLWSTLTQGKVWTGEFRNMRKDGTRYIELATISPIKRGDGRTTHYVAVKEDITARRQSEDLINRLAYFDSLTGLPNRALLLDRLEQARLASHRSKQYAMLLLLDIDNFKLLNETQGHDAGDRLLMAVAQRLRDSVREQDTVARLGGDDFAVIIGDLGPEEESAIGSAELIAEKIHTSLGQAYDLDIPGGRYHGTPSIGITLFRSRRLSGEDLLKQAEVALYKAKDDGRNAVRFFSPAMQAVVHARAEMERGLRETLAGQGFQLHYQPQVDSDGRIVGAEALVRWIRPDGKRVSPADFIPLAEETGLIVPIGSWVLETACAQLCAWAANPDTRHLSLAVNVSGRQFYQPDFVDEVRDCIDRFGINSGNLKLELTESIVLSDVEDTIARMEQIRALGVRFALDDFGTGYSSLSYLKRLRFDQLKIDQSFVRDMIVDKSSAAIVRAILAMSESLGLEAVAEGVETEPQSQILHQQGCRTYQGYLFGRPMPIEDWNVFWAERSQGVETDQPTP